MKVRVEVEETYLKWRKRLPPDRTESADQAIVKFMKEPKLHSLKFRRLKSTPRHFIISSARGDRIILRQDEDDEHLYAAVDVGPHDNVYRRWNR